MSVGAAAGFDATPFAAPHHSVAKHFRVEVAGETLIFCYIRKNGSSAFKSLVLDVSPGRDDVGNYDGGYAFMRARHRAASLTAATRSVLVVRDPADRLVSTFRNKFVQRAGAAGIFASYRNVTGLDPEEASFEDFVLRYLAAPGAVLDPHVAPQVSHVFPARYSDATPLASLHATMAGIVGPELAARHFGKPVNATGAFRDAPEAEAWTRPARALTEAFLRDGLLPSRAALLAPPLAAACAEAYAADLALVAAVEQHHRAAAMQATGD